MARLRKISAAAMNIAADPHSNEIYRAIISSIFKLKKPIKIAGDRYAILSFMRSSETEPDFFSGVISTFTQIDLSGRWFDAAEMSDADDEKISKVIIPEGLFPNASSFYFIFDADKHALYYQNYSNGKTLTPRSSLNLFRGLVSDLSITERFGNINVSIIQSQEALDTLFSLKQIRKIEIVIQRPNADIFNENFEQDIEAHLNSMHSKQVSVAYDAAPGQSITPTQEIRTVSRAALRNGSVKVIGRDDTGAKVLSSEDHPHILQDRYDPEQTSEESAFRRLVGQ
jgi:hypothetical protein